MKRLTLTAGALSLLCAFGALRGTAQPMTQFNTGVTNFLYIGRPGFNASTATTAIHRTFDPTDPGGGFEAIGTPLSTTNQINGFGLNHMDGFLYGISFPASPFTNDPKLYRVGRNGVTQQLGIVSGPTATDAGRPFVLFSFVNTTAGVVDGDGHYWFTAYTLQSTPTISNFDFYLGKVANVSALANGGTGNITPTYYKLDISNARLQTGFTKFLQQVNALMAAGQSVTLADGGAEDIAIRPAENIYTYVQFPTSYNAASPGDAVLEHYPLKLDISQPGNWKLVPIGTTSNTTPNREIVGTYFDLLGRMFVLFSNGQYSEVNLTNGTLVGLQQSVLPLDQGNLRGDLASNIVCASVPLNFKFTAFAGRMEGATTMLSWQTGDEKAVSKYVVERCDDGISFRPVAEQRASGAGLYTATDVMPNSLATYRIKAVGAGEEVSYTSILRLAKPSIKGSVTTVYPTLLTGETVRVQTDRAAAIVQVVDLNGRIMRSELIGNRGENITMPGLAAGMYILSVRDANTGEMLLNQRITKP